MFFFFSIVLNCIARQITDQSAPEWDYRDTNRWIADYPTCGGSLQSPINLDSYTVSNEHLNFVVIFLMYIFI